MSAAARKIAAGCQLITAVVRYYDARPTRRRLAQGDELVFYRLTAISG